MYTTDLYAIDIRYFWTRIILLKHSLKKKRVSILRHLSYQGVDSDKNLVKFH